VVAEAGEVRFVDDSKATNPRATLAALEGKRDVVLIAGGLAKGLDLSPLASGAGSLRGVVAIGQSAPALVELFDGMVPVRLASSMEEAVEEAFGLSAPGGEVLLAPGCASMDMFRDYRERGDRFADAARTLARSRSQNHDQDQRHVRLSAPAQISNGPAEPGRSHA
jgi:UDP-N-acetylmuramoylalanine--D-glutamate ligase